MYMLRLSNDAFYTGITNNIPARLKAHAEGKGSKYVRAHLPFKLVYVVDVRDRSEASKLEAKIKKLNHVRKLAMANEYKGERYGFPN